MLSKEMMEKAEARCLELVNDREVYKKYDPLFRKAVEKFGVQVVAELAAEAKNGGWAGTAAYSYRFTKIPLGFVIEWESLRDSKKFGHYDGRGVSTEFSRTVFGLVLEDWLISYKEAVNPAPMNATLEVIFKKGDMVRLLVDKSLGGNTSNPAGTILKVDGEDKWGSKKCYIVGSNYYYPEQLRLVVAEEASHLDRAIAEQKEYYAPKNPCSEITAEDYAIEDALEEARKLTNSANARIERINSILNKESAMSLKIETKTFVNGAEIAKLTVEELVSLIQRTEDEIKKLEALANKPKKVQQKIQQLTDGLAELVKFADAE